MKHNIIILCGAQQDIGIVNKESPPYLTEIDGISLLEKIIHNASAIKNATYTFAFGEQDATRFHLDKVVGLLIKDANIISTPATTQGSACTALLAACKLEQNNALLIISANELVDIDFSGLLTAFQARNLDGGTVIFRSVHPRYSYVRLNNEELITEIAQQDPISHHATAGVFWFKKTADFVEGAKNLIRKNASLHNKFFVAPTFNEMILKQKRIGVSKIELNKYHPLKNEQQVQKFQLRNDT